MATASFSPSMVRITAGAPGLAATPLLPEEVQTTPRTVRGAPHCEHPTSHTNQAPLCPRAIKPTSDVPIWAKGFRHSLLISPETAPGDGHLDISVLQMKPWRRGYSLSPSSDIRLVVEPGLK